jgi:hypothetical protein
MPPDEPQFPFEAADLRKAVTTAIRDTTVGFLRSLPQPPDDTLIAHVVTCQLGNYDLGEYIIDQNPYAICAQINFPAIPTLSSGDADLVSETRRIRITGVLKDNNSTLPLSPTAPVPGGFIFDFTCPDLLSLDDGDGTSTVETPPGGTGGDLHNKKEVYHHNVVKIVRFRYIATNRVDNGTQLSPAYLLVMYSGGDT